ncbi:hypothetical protein SAMN04515666_101333 [Bosea lupini]|uniref:Uncharacterized protein n=1 Tax=Bosea lupini TaxID=1036779 RepID=A0A1H7GKZ2_9HYPH|nr:hypothetical protein [Bosea lupini]SEK36535.1 hypothetical protein SAMN04515666_101333 [Bosea lupini]
MSSGPAQPAPILTEKMIADAEKAVRRTIISEATGTPEDAAFVRFARDLCPLFTRKTLEEVRLHGITPAAFTAKVKVIAWMMAQCVATMPAGSDKAGAVKRLADAIGDHAANMVSEPEAPASRIIKPEGYPQ